MKNELNKHEKELGCDKYLEVKNDLKRHTNYKHKEEKTCKIVKGIIL